MSGTWDRGGRRGEGEGQYISSTHIESTRSIMHTPHHFTTPTIEYEDMEIIITLDGTMQTYSTHYEGARVYDGHAIKPPCLLIVLRYQKSEPSPVMARTLSVNGPH